MHAAISYYIIAAGDDAQTLKRAPNPLSPIYQAAVRTEQQAVYNTDAHQAGDTLFRLNNVV